MTPITEQLAEAARAVDTEYEGGSAGGSTCIENVTLSKLHVALAEYDRLRTAEGGEGLHQNEEVLFRAQCYVEVIRDNPAHQDVLRWAQLALAEIAAVRSILAAAPPPQPVAPERGEAKAVAYTRTVIATDGPPGCNYCGGQAGGGSIYPKCPACGREPTTDAQTREVSYGPQPPPAPRFRDPTIEDANNVRASFVKHYARMNDSRAMLIALNEGGFVVNAIGAKVEETK